MGIQGSLKFCLPASLASEVGGESVTTLPPCPPPPLHIENNLLVWMLGFISILVWGGRDVDWCLDLCYYLGGLLVYNFFLGGGGGLGGGFLWNS